MADDWYNQWERADEQRKVLDKQKRTITNSRALKKDHKVPAKPEEVMPVGTTKISMINAIRRNVKFYDLEKAYNQLRFKDFRDKFNTFFIFLENFHTENPGWNFEPTLNMIAMFTGFKDYRLMQAYLEGVHPRDRVHKPVTIDEIRATLAVFHEMRASSPGMSAKWLERHFPLEWSRHPDMTRGGAGLSVDMDGDGGGITVRIIRDYRGPEDDPEEGE